LATGHDDGTVRLWSSPQSPAIGRPIRLGRPVESLSFRDGSRLLVAAGGEVRTWEFDHEEMPSPAGRARSPAEMTVLSPDGRLVATLHRVGTRGGRVELRDWAAQRLLRATPEQPDPILGAAFSPDSRELLTWSERPDSVRLWDAAALRD